jgi:two-component system chemotaxis response regulator CheV
MTMARGDILLESGTNEVEIAEFVLAGQKFGINVAKIREFIPLKGLTISHLPQTPASLDGVFLLRGRSIPLINLSRHLGLNDQDVEGEKVVVVVEFNNLVSAYVADAINQIHRVSWDEFKPLSYGIGLNSSAVTGSINRNDCEILVLDMEHIVGELFPNTIVNYDQKRFAEAPKPSHREDLSIYFAEDSAIIRNQVSAILRSVGFQNLSVFENGELAFNALKEAADSQESAQNAPNILVTDIEMPRMDGLSLCRRTKQDLKLEIPVIMFSSLINEQMAAKCRQVGADAYIAKPETERLISLIDELTLKS